MRALLLFEQDRQRLLIRFLGEHLDLGRRAAADRMLDHDERIVGQAHHTCDVARRDLKRVSAQDDCALAKLFEADAIMQTAR